MQFNIALFVVYFARIDMIEMLFEMFSAKSGMK